MNDAIDTRPLRGFEDFAVGDRFETGSINLSESDIIEFARRYDPQYFHLDPVAAKDSLFGQHVASGWQTASLTMKLIVEQGFRVFGGMIGSEVSELRWGAVYPGDQLRVIGEVIECRPSRSKPDRGVIKLRFRTLSQRGEVQHMIAVQVVKRRRAA